ncbi:MAG: cysteine desulfurase [Alphaproteobacteria bacterium]|nr:MAG: cysteine desulfurase [Alphaproteobacteria bacterium]
MVEKKVIYFDYNATRPIRSSVKKLLAEMYEYTGNPSSIHTQGAFMKKKLENARTSVAKSLSIHTKNIIWTSGATESNNTVLQGYKGPVIVSAVEHPSVFNVREDKLICRVDKNGVINLQALEHLLQKYPKALVCVTAAVSETGVLQPLEEIIELTHKFKGFVFSDCVQAVGRTQVPWDKLDGFSLSGHKIGTPFGIGMLALKPALKLQPLMIGGGQENYKRAGTINVYGALAFAQALTETLNESWDYVKKLRATFETELQKIYPDAIIVGQDAPRLPNTIGLITPNLLSSTQMMSYDIEGFCLSLGIACSSGTMKTNENLERMGFSKKLADCFIRISLGTDNTLEEVHRFLEATQKLKGRSQAKYAS